jgi:hypothetical protein
MVGTNGRPPAVRLPTWEVLAMSAGELHHLRDRVEHVEEQTDAAITDIRGLAKLQREHHAENGKRFASIEKLLKALADTQAAQGIAWNGHITRIEIAIGAALSKASGAHRIASEAERRVSQIENEQDEWDAKMAVSKADGDVEARAFRRKLIMKLAGGGGVSVVLALIAAISQCSGG